MNQIIIARHNGIIKHARLLTTGFNEDGGERWQPMAYVAGLDYQWFDYIPLYDIPAYQAWYQNFTKATPGELATAANVNVRYNFLKGWAALNLLIEDPTALYRSELIMAIEAAVMHKRTLIGRNALEILQCESDYREFGRCN